MVRWARRRAGFSQRELAERAGVPQSTVARIESGAVDPRASTLRSLLRVCEVDLEAMAVIGRGIDVSLIREDLKKSPRERLDDGAIAAENTARLFGSARRAR